MPRHTLTLSLTEEVVAKAKILAAQRRTSVSRLFASFVEEQSERDRAYLTAKRRALKCLEQGFDLGARRVSREELHERPGVR